MNGKTCGGKGFPECDDTLVRNEDDDEDIYDDNENEGNMIDMVFKSGSIAERRGRVRLADCPAMSFVFVWYQKYK